MKNTTLANQVGREHHYGIDLLRTLSMFMVLILHILGYGGILGALKPGSGNYLSAWFLESCAFCAVNCYALISGYVGVDARYRYSNLALLWIQVVLYMLLGTGLFAVFVPGSVTVKTVIKCFFPFLRNEYWYFTAYCCLFLIMPLLNLVVRSLSKKQAAVMCGLLFLVFSVVLTLRRSDDVLQMGNGYSVHWLAMLYVIGGCVKKHGFLQRVPDGLLLLGYFLCAAASVGVMIVISTTSIEIISGNIRNDILMQYTSPTVFLCGLCLLVLCSKHPRLPKPIEKAISILSPVSFGVYVIHTQPQICDFFFNKTFKPFAAYSVPGMIGAVFLTAVTVYAICTVLDSLRIRLFQALSLRQRLNRLEERLLGNLWQERQEAEK